VVGGEGGGEGEARAEARGGDVEEEEEMGEVRAVVEDRLRVDTAPSVGSIFTRKALDHIGRVVILALALHCYLHHLEWMASGLRPQLDSSRRHYSSPEPTDHRRLSRLMVVHGTIYSSMVPAPGTPAPVLRVLCSTAATAGLFSGTSSSAGRAPTTLASTWGSSGAWILLTLLVCGGCG